MMEIKYSTNKIMETTTENYGKQATQNASYWIPNHLYILNI